MASPNGLLIAGHHGDMSHVWSLVEELSGQLQSNREQFQQLEDRIASRRADEPCQIQGSGTDENGRERDDRHVGSVEDRDRDREEIGNRDETPNHSGPTRAQLLARLAEAERRISGLETAYRDQSELVLSYENGMQSVTDKLRGYMFEQTKSTLAVHAHYKTQLAQSRAETLSARLTHQAWQAAFARLAGDLRKAVRAHEHVTRPYRRRIAGLREENRVLRLRAGWELASDSEDGAGDADADADGDADLHADGGESEEEVEEMHP